MFTGARECQRFRGEQISITRFPRWMRIGLICPSDSSSSRVIPLCFAVLDEEKIEGLNKSHASQDDQHGIDRVANA